MAIVSVTIGLLVCLTVCVSTTAGALVKGRCPNIEGQKDFDIDQYLGKWYVIDIFANFLYHDVCLNIEYKRLEDGKMRVHFNDNKKPMEKSVVQDSSNLAKFHYHLSEEDSQPMTFIETIVVTDYENYAVEFSCADLVGDLSIQYAWIVTREKEVNPDRLKALKEKLQSMGIDITHFHTVDQSNCEAP